MVVVQFTVTVPDVERFKRTYEKFLPLVEEDGGKDLGVFASENNPNELTMMSEWESHDAMHVSSERRGEAFQAEAGTEGLEWETRVLHRLA